MLNSGTDEMLRNALKDLFKQKDTLFLAQLGDLVTKGLLVIEETAPVIVQTPYDHTSSPGHPEFRLEQSVRFVLKDQEYIKKLEKRVEQLEAVIKDLNTVMEAV